MSQIVVLGQFDIHPEDTEAVAALMSVMMTETNREPGCLHYAFSRDLTNPNRFQLSELWEDDASLSSHMDTPHMATYRAGLAKLRVESRNVQRYSATAIGKL